MVAAVRSREELKCSGAGTLESLIVPGLETTIVDWLPVLPTSLELSGPGVDPRPGSVGSAVGSASARRRQAGKMMTSTSRKTVKMSEPDARRFTAQSLCEQATRIDSIITSGDRWAA